MKQNVNRITYQNLKQGETPFAIFSKSLIIGLIYPAVLGNILYLILTVYTNKSDLSSYPYWTEKFALLCITALFYCLDYIYLYLTYRFRWWMILLDIVFIVILFYTIGVIQLSSTQKISYSHPNWLMILYYYGTFMLLYLIWDFIELRFLDNTDHNGFYRWVVSWEITSIALILMAIFLFKKELFGWTSEWCFVALVLITGSFAVVDIYKYKYWTKYHFPVNEFDEKINPDVK